MSSVMSRLSERTVVWMFATSTISTMSRTVMSISTNITMRMGALAMSTSTAVAVVLAVTAAK